MDRSNITTTGLKEDQNYNHQAIISLLMEDNPKLSRNSVQWVLGDLLHEGFIVRNGYDSYSVAEQKLPDYSPFYSEQSLALMQTISKKYPLTEFTVFETILMNEFLNHLIARNTVIVQCERDVAPFIFREIQEKNDNCLFNPSMKEFDYYWKPGCIVVCGLVSEFPANNEKPHYITIEKMVVDMYCDRYIRSAYELQEYPEIVRQIRKKYSVNEAGMFRYARRRNKEKEIRNIWENSYAES